MQSMPFSIKKLKLSIFWVRGWLIMAAINILVTHLSQPEFFPLNEAYQFPLIPILIAISFGTLILTIVDLNFQYFQRKHFIDSFDSHTLLRFLLSNLGYIFILYIPLYYSVNGLRVYTIYYLLSGLFVTLLLWTVGIIFTYGQAIYKLYKSRHVEGKFKIAHSGKITLIDYDEIAFAYSQNKIAYITKSDGTSIPTDFTLNEIEEKINAHHFYRANRQTILHPSAIGEVQSIENGKLSVLLKPALANKQPIQLTISRYKKQEFLSWFENRS